MVKNKNFKRIVCLINLFLVTTATEASTYNLPASGQDIVGTAKYVSASSGDSLVEIAKRYDVGFNQIRDANPGRNPVAPLSSGTAIEVPSRFLLPPLARRGIVINLPEMRMYYYPEKSGTVKTYPIGIGKIGKTIPVTKTAIKSKVENPRWVPTEDIRAFNEEKNGIVLPRVMAAGPENPLGPYGIYLKIPTFLIHSTIFPESVGKRASFGCIRMHEADIKDFFPLVTPGLPVTIINLPTKLGWSGKRLYMETHAPLEEHSAEADATLSGMIRSIQNKTRGQVTMVNWQLVADLEQIRDGVPHEVGFKVR